MKGRRDLQLQVNILENARDRSVQGTAALRSTAAVHKQTVLLQEDQVGVSKEQRSNRQEADTVSTREGNSFPQGPTPGLGKFKIKEYLNMISLLLKRNLHTGFRLLGKNVKLLNRSRVPVLQEQEIEEKFVKGWGPGGQAVNKTSNAVFLRHNPTGIWVKCHETRSLDSNRKIARTLLITKLDNHLNGEDSLESQERRITSLSKEKKKERTRLKYELRRLEKETLVEGFNVDSVTSEDITEPVIIQASHNIENPQTQDLNSNKEI